MSISHMDKIVILENIRSSYNVGNIIRTADALGWKVWLVWYTPSPFALQKWQAKVAKTSLGAEHNVDLRIYSDFATMLEAARSQHLYLCAAELTDTAQAIDQCVIPADYRGIGLVMGNEVTGVEQETLQTVDKILYIPMQGTKESLNVGQAAAIMMWQLWKNISHL